MTDVADFITEVGFVGATEVPGGWKSLLAPVDSEELRTDEEDLEDISKAERDATLEYSALKFF